MDARRALGIQDPTAIPVVAPRTVAATQVGSASMRSLPRRWAWFAALVGPVVAAFCIGVEPAPADPNAPTPLVGTVLVLALLASWAGAAVGALQRHSRALGWAAAGGLLSVAMTVTCPASAHHVGLGAWWFGQLAVSGAALAVAVVGLARYGRPPTAGL